MKRRGLCLVLAAPSGAGKTSLSRALLDGDEFMSLSVSATTRAPRPGEQEGVHYYFKTPETFAAMIAAGDFLEHASVFGRSYGTPRAPVEAALAAGRDILFDIDWQGYRQLRAALPNDVMGVFIRTPTLADLRTRLVGRGDDAATIARRMAEAETELAHQTEFDFIIENRDFEVALTDLRAVRRACRLMTSRLA
ncbi:MAG: guanylate kinase [Acidiphilium sp. 37-64-53]|uniref:guanylate kinase n=1 Tax=Acidiphilium TaxID=522 RepID=UPI000BC845D1|nr:MULTISPECIES: guanylate kinase [Acidiphilium]OYW02678.1 MAG: guanylate kinase [Acidiphilium sp. 37-64-53]OZB29965.1 MAG: guanylate kinase [Acidiphilium sp. 34-64-41]HQT85121.1 guanylate kinase [Acidiphilium rubrum]